MGKWAARLAEKTAAPTHGGTAKTEERGLVSVLAATQERGARDSQAAQTAASETAGQLAAVDLATVAWTDADLSAYRDRRARLLRWGWAELEAVRLAKRLVMRDREHDERVSCADCEHYRRGRCGNHRRAGLNTADVGRDWVAMLQRCPGFQPVR
jgi:hypothetical protein